MNTNHKQDDLLSSMIAATPPPSNNAAVSSMLAATPPTDHPSNSALSQYFDPGTATDPSDPKTYLRGIPRNRYDGNGALKQLPVSQVDQLNDKFAQPLSEYLQDVEAHGYKPELTAGYEPSGHNANSYHYYGQAADVVLTDKGGAVIDPRQNKGVANMMQDLASQHGLSFLNEYETQTAATTGGHFHLQSMDPREASAAGPKGVSKLRDTAEGMAKYYGIDRPQIFSRLIGTESSWDWQAKSGVGAYGLGQIMPENIPGLAKQLGFDPKQYYTDPNIQLKASAFMFSQLLKQTGSYAKALAAYNSGPGGLAKAEQNGQIPYAETRNYVANILGISPKDADGAVAGQDPRFAYNPGQAAQNISATEQAEKLDVLHQTLRNTAPFMNSAWGGPIVSALAGNEAMSPDYKLPFSSFAGGTTTNDDEWASDHLKSMASMATLGITSLIPALHASGQYEDYLKSYHTTLLDMINPTKWGDEGVQQNMVDGMASLSTLAIFADGLLPAAGKAIMGTGAWTAFQGTSLGMSMLGKAATATEAAVPSALEAWLGKNAAKLSGPTQKLLTYLQQSITPGGPTFLGTGLKWAGLMGTSAFNGEMGDQIAAGKSVEEGFPSAMHAALQGSVSGMLASVAIPMGLTATGAFLRGATGAIAPGIMDFIEQKMPSVAEAVQKGFDAIPDSVKSVVQAPIRFMLSSMDEYEKNGLGKMVQNSLNDVLNEGNQAYAANQAPKMLQTVSSVSDRFNKTASFLDGKLKQTMNDYQSADRNVKMFSGEIQKQTATPGVVQWGALQQAETQAKTELANVEQAASKLKPGDPQKQTFQEEIKNTLRPKADTAEATRLHWEGTNPEVLQMQNLQKQLTDAQNAKAMVATDPFFKNQKVIGQQVSNMQLIGRNLEAYKGQVQDWANNRMQKPDLSKSMTLDQILGGSSKISQDQRDMLTLYDDALRRKLDQAADSRMPLIERELMQPSVLAANSTGVNPTKSFSALQGVANDIESRIAAVRKGAGGDMTKAQAQALKPWLANLKGYVTNLKNVSDSGALPGDLASKVQGVKTWQELFDSGVPVLPLLAKDPSTLVPTDPVTVNLTKEALWKAGLTVLQEGRNLIPAQLQQRLMDESIGFLKMQGDIDHGINPGPQSPGDQMFREYMAQHLAFKDGVDGYLRGALNKLLRPDEIFGASTSIISDSIGIQRSAMDVGKRLADGVDADIRSALKLGKKDAMPVDVQNAMVKALESPDADAYRKLFTQHPELYQPLRNFMGLQGYLERLKAVSPQMKPFMRDNYLTHKYPRLLDYLRGEGTGGSGQAGLASFRKLSTEQLRTLPTLEEAERKAASAEKTLGEAGLTWKQFSGMGSDTIRSERLFGNPDMADQARQVMFDSMLGNPVKDLPSLLRFNIASTFKSDGIRQMLTQFRTLKDEFGNPLLVRTEDVPKLPRTQYPEPPKGSVRTNTFGPVKTGVNYVRMGDVNGLRGINLLENGQEVPASGWHLHPQAADYINSYASFDPTRHEGLLGDLESLGNIIRSGSLITGGTAHLWSIMSNMFMATNFNWGASMGLFSMGRKALAETPSLILDAQRHGLDCANLIQMSKEIPQALLSQPGSEELAKSLYGLTPEAQNYQNQFLNSVSKGVIKPLESYVNASHWANRVTMFNAISEAQVGAWLYKTSMLWKKLGPQMLETYGGDYSAALTQVKKLAAEEANTLAGVTSTHMVQQTIRNQYYRYALTPQFTMTRARLLMGALDGAVQSFGGRSMFAHITDPTLQGVAKANMANMLAGGIIAGSLFTDMMSIAINGRDTSTNPTDKSNHVLVSSDPSGGETYIMNPFFGMFKPFFKTLREVGAIHKDTGDLSYKPFLDTVSSLLNPALTSAYETVQGQDSQGNPLPNDVSAASAGRFATNLMYKFNMPGVTGVSDIPEPGTKLSPAERIFSLLGTTTVRRLTGVRDASQIEQELRPYETDLNQKVDTLLSQAAQMGGVSSPQGQELIKQASDLAFKQGVPMGNPAISSLFKQAGLGGPDGNYVYVNEDSFNARLLKFVAPLAAAKVPGLMQPLLQAQIKERQSSSKPEPGSIRDRIGG